MYSSFSLGQGEQQASFQSDQMSDLVLLSEQLAQEVRELRGIVEQQSYELRKIQQQRIDDYRSLDKRIAQLAEPTGVAAANEPPVVGSHVAPSQVATAATVPGLSEKESYRQAYTLVKKRDFVNAVTAFQTFLEQFPDGNYAGNAYYWLGELFDLDGDYTSAQKSMLSLITQFPEHRKVADAHYKLARVFHKMGEADKAQQHANTVIDKFGGIDATAVSLAREFLSKNYP